MKKVTLATLTSVTALGIVMTGCGSPTANNTDNGGGSNAPISAPQQLDLKNAKGEIVWAANPITNNKDIRQDLANRFMAEHPNIKVTVQNQSNDSETNKASLVTAIGGGASSPDLYLADVAWVAQMAQSQLALPLDKYLPQDFFGRFAKGLTDGATYKGNIYAAPFFVDASFLFYRKDLLAKEGLPVPQSWEDVQKDALKIKNDGLAKYGFVWQGASYEGLTCNYLEDLTDANGKILDSNGKPALNGPEAKKALSFMSDLINFGASPKAVTTFKENESMTAFESGDAAFLRNWSYAWSDSQDAKNSKVVGKVGVATLPTFGGPNGYSTIGGWNLMVNPHSKNLAADLAFVDWLTGPEAQKIVATDYSELPSNAAAQSDPTVQKISPIFENLSKVQFVPRPTNNPNYAQISQNLYQSVNQALSGGSNVDDALANAQKQIGAVTSGNGGL